MYSSALEGNHTDKHIGALASAAFVESKYKDCLYFSEETYHEQMQLRAMIQFAKDGMPKEAEPAGPTTEDLVRQALNRNHQQTSHHGAETDESLLRSFGGPSSSDDLPNNPRKARTKGQKSTRQGVRRQKSLDTSMEGRGERPLIRRSDSRKEGLRRSVTSDGATRSDYHRSSSDRRLSQRPAMRRASSAGFAGAGGLRRPSGDGSGRRSSTRRGSLADPGNHHVGGSFRRSSSGEALHRRGSRSPAHPPPGARRSTSRDPPPIPRNSHSNMVPHVPRPRSRTLSSEDPSRIRKTSDHDVRPKRNSSRSPLRAGKVRELPRKPAPVLDKCLVDDDHADDDSESQGESHSSDLDISVSSSSIVSEENEGSVVSVSTASCHSHSEGIGSSVSENEERVLAGSSQNLLESSSGRHRRQRMVDILQKSASPENGT